MRMLKYKGERVGQNYQKICVLFDWSLEFKFFSKYEKFGRIPSVMNILSVNVKW